MSDLPKVFFSSGINNKMPKGTEIVVFTGVDGIRRAACVNKNLEILFHEHGLTPVTPLFDLYPTFKIPDEISINAIVD